MTEEEKEAYANWILNEAEHPVNHIVWLINRISEEDMGEIDDTKG